MDRSIGPADIPELVEIRKADARYRELTGKGYFSMDSPSANGERVLFHFEDGVVKHTPVSALAHMLRTLRTAEDSEAVPECSG